MNKRLGLYFVCCISLVFLVLAETNTSDEVLIISLCHNREDLIPVQYETFGAFLKDKYKLVVFNDAPQEDMAQKIENVCNSLDIQCIRIPQENRPRYPGPFPPVSSRHGQSINYALETLGFKHDGIVMMVHSDVFLLKEFSANEFLEGYDIAGQLQIRKSNIRYFHTALMFFRMNNLPNKETITFRHQQIDGVWVDTGGSIYYYFQANPEVRVLFFEPEYRLLLNNDLKVQALGADEKRFNLHSILPEGKQANDVTILKELGFNEKIIDYVKEKKFAPDIEFLLYDTFFHYRRVTNYNGKSQSFHKKKTQLFQDFIDDILS